MCECFQVGGKFVAEDPDCPVHGIEAQKCKMEDEAIHDLCEEMAVALKPFAALLQDHNSQGHDEKPIFAINDAMIKLGDLRRAVALIKKAENVL